MTDHDLEGFLRRSIETSAVAAERGLQTRSYQIDLAARALRALRSGHSAAVTLPTGAGKTMVADLVTRSWATRYPDHTVLSVVPRRVLIDQHRHHGQWLTPPLRVTTLRSGERRYLNRRIRDAQLVITTPKLLGNAIYHDRLEPEFLETIHLVIIDEIDAFLTTTWSESGVTADIHEALALLLSGLPNPRFLLLTATPPETTQTETADEHLAMADALATTFGVRTWKTASPHAIARFMPAATVVWTLVEDDHVQDLDDAIDNELTILLDRIDEITPNGADRDYLRLRHSSISNGRIRTYLTADGRRIPVSSEVRSLCGQLTRRYGQRLFLYEDDMAGYSTYPATYRGRAINRLAEPDQRGHRAELHGKYDAARSILDAHPHTAGIVFVRYLAVAEELAAHIHSHGRPTEIIHGQLTDRQRTNTRDWFRHCDNGVLILTRDTGRRGLDIPEADFAIFYSPKRSARSMWQEMSRIRATTDNLKPTYILVYDDTSESLKAHAAAEQMSQSQRWYDQRTHRP